MGDITLFNGLVLPTAWNIDDESQFVSIDSSGLKILMVIICANNPISSQCGLFYLEIEILNEGKNGGKLYGLTFTVGDTIGCYLNFRNDDKMIFYTKNGINLGIACYLPNNLDDLKNNLYPCIGLRSQGAYVEANFGRKKFKYLSKFYLTLNFGAQLKFIITINVSLWIAMTNDHISKELWEACWINSKPFDQYVDELKNKSNDTLALMSRGKAYLIIGKYEEAYAVLTRLLEIESENIIALKY
ncbi:hypothetical protein C2G38_2206228, partial [Gigaspora rosea]